MSECQILRLKCTEFDFRWGTALHPAVGAYSAPPDSLAVFKGPTSKEREGEEGKGKGSGREGEGKGRKGKTRGREERGRDQAPNISA